MTKIKVNVPVSPETVEREITLPAYRKDKFNGFYKVVSEESTISVADGDDSYCISHTVRTSMDVLTSREYSDCSKEDFEAAYERTLDKLSSLQIQQA